MSLISYVVDFFTPASVKKRRADAELHRDTYSILESIKFLCGVAIGKAKRDGGLVYAAWDETHGTIHSRGMFTEIEPGVILVTQTAGSVDGVLDQHTLRETLKQYAAGFDRYMFQQFPGLAPLYITGVFGEYNAQTVGYIIDLDKRQAFFKRAPNKGLQVSVRRAHIAALLKQIRGCKTPLPFMLEVCSVSGLSQRTAFCYTDDTLPYCDAQATERVLTQYIADLHPNDVLVGTTHARDHHGELWRFTLRPRYNAILTDTSTHCD